MRNRGGAGVLASALALGGVAAVHAEAEPRVFTPAEIASWDAHAFNGETAYELVEIDGREAVHAVCDEGTSSGLFLRDEFDLAKRPIIEWTWRVGSAYGDIDETVKAGDDYVARIYVVDASPVLAWRTRAISYVWSSAMPVGADWVNAYAEQVHMIAVASGDQGTGEWRTHRRDLRADFLRHHRRELEQVDAIAIMSDCDDAGGSGEAWFGEIRLLPD